MQQWQSKKFIYIYGTGTFAHHVLEVLSRHGLTINGFLDHLPRQPVVEGLPCSLPENIAAGERRDAAVAIGIQNREAQIAGIIARLKALGFGHVATPVDLYDTFAEEMGHHFWLAPRAFYTEEKGGIKSVARLFTDPQSRDLFDIILKFRVSGDYSLLPPPDPKHMYFPPGIPPWQSPLRIIDCGAYDGDTLRNFIENGQPVEAVVAYEPDESNYRGLVKTIRMKKILNAAAFPCGVFSSTKKMHFSAGQGEASSISSEGEVVIQCVSVDESTMGFAPNLIKMDIEGAELEALRGAERTIIKYQPGLALSVYHTPAHLWEIPLWVADLARRKGLRYTFHLRMHACNFFDTVFYAVPRY